MKNLILQKSLFYKISTMLVLAVITVSCGSYQSVSYNDGIYSDDENNNASLNQNIQQDNEVIYEDGSSAIMNLCLNKVQKVMEITFNKKKFLQM